MSFRTGPVLLGGVNWVQQYFNPILAMHSLSDNQDLACLQFAGGVDLDCVRRILEIVKGVKRQPSALLCLLTDIVTATDSYLCTMDLALMLDPVEQATTFLDEESTTCLLRPVALGLKTHCQRVVVPWEEDFPYYTRITLEVQRVCGLLQAKYSASLVASTTQLRLLSCAGSATVAQPATGWLRMHVPL